MRDEPSFGAIASRYDRSRRVPEDLLDRSLTRALAPWRRRGARVLECGCGTGQILQVLTRASPSVVGIDIEPAMVDVARDKVGPPVRIVESDATDLPFSAGSFDVVVMAHLLEHVAAWQHAVREAFRVLAPDGALVLVFTPGFVHSMPRSLLKREIATRGWALRRTGASGREEIVAWLEHQGFHISWISDPSWTWQRRVDFREVLDQLERREVSVFWGVPDDVYEDALRAVQRIVAEQDAASESVTATLHVCVVRA